MSTTAIIIIIVAVLMLYSLTAKADNIPLGFSAGSKPLFKIDTWEDLPLIKKVPGDQKAFGNKVIAISQKLGVTPDSLMSIMDYESAGSFRANKWGGWNNQYVGLIQFGAAAAKDLGTTQAHLSALTNVEQLNYVLQYFEMWRKRLKINKINGIEDLYLMVLWPKGVQEKDYNKPLPIPGQQAKNLYNKDGQITKDSIKSAFNKRYTFLNA